MNFSFPFYFVSLMSTLCFWTPGEASGQSKLMIEKDTIPFGPNENSIIHCKTFTDDDQTDLSLNGPAIISAYNAHTLDPVISEFSPNEKWIEILNPGLVSIDISGWEVYLRTDLPVYNAPPAVAFTFPQGSFINGREAITIGPQNTGFNPDYLYNISDNDNSLIEHVLFYNETGLLIDELVLSNRKNIFPEAGSRWRSSAFLLSNFDANISRTGLKNQFHKTDWEEQNPTPGVASNSLVHSLHNENLIGNWDIIDSCKSSESFFKSNRRHTLYQVAGRKTELS